MGMHMSLLLLTLLSAALRVQALYFYMDSTVPKCFFEELPKDTLVVGHYTADTYDHQTNTYGHNPDLKMLITVDEQFNHHHQLVKQWASTGGKFSFTAAESGDHKICFAPSSAAAGGWLSGGQALGTIKMTLDLAIGETSQIESDDKPKIDTIVQKVKDLRARLEDIKREQVFQREREAEFRDQSEATNSRVVKWTLIQLVVLGVTCAWQLSHLRAFFIKQKLT